MTRPLLLDPPTEDDRSAGLRRSGRALRSRVDEAGLIESLRASWQFDQMRFEPAPP